MEQHKHLIIDTGAILTGVISALPPADNYWTVDEVLLEVRDKHSRERLANLPFQLRTRAPSDVAIRAVADFARFTGNYWSLSKPDMLVLALAYMFESEENGDQFLREAPSRPQDNGQLHSVSSAGTTHTRQASNVPSGEPANAGEDDSDWITPDNIDVAICSNGGGFGCQGETASPSGMGAGKAQQANDKVQHHPRQNGAVVCVTGDFAMQNVLLQPVGRLQVTFVFCHRVMSGFVYAYPGLWLTPAARLHQASTG